MTRPSDSTPSLLDGVEDAVLAWAIERFYGRMLSDRRVSHYFDNVDMVRLRAHQRSFLVAALGDPGTFNALTLQHSHYRLGLTDSEFDITAGHLIESLLEAGVPATLKDEIERRLQRVRTHVVAPVRKPKRGWRLRRHS